MRFDINTDLTVQAWEEMAAVSTASWISSSVSSASSATETPPPGSDEEAPKEEDPNSEYYSISNPHPRRS